MTPIEQEKVAIGWVIAAILSAMAYLPKLITILLCAQAFISIIATIIISYKHHGTKKRKTNRKTRG